MSHASMIARFQRRMSSLSKGAVFCSSRTVPRYRVRRYRIDAAGVITARCHGTSTGWAWITPARPSRHRAHH